MDRSPDPPAEPTACVFTTLFGAYERLNEQPKAHESSVPFIVVTDDDQLRSGTWTPRIVNPTFPADPIRSQREVKISPHEVLEDFDVSLYIDNTVVLMALPEAIFDRYLADDTIFAIPRHSFRASVEDEFLEVARLGLDEDSRVFEQLSHYDMAAPMDLDDHPFWTGFMIRRHLDAHVQDFSRKWLAHVLRYSRRDQLSINTALRQSGLRPSVLELDNHASWCHTWPHAANRDRNRGYRSSVRSRGPRRSRERHLEQQNAELQRHLADLETRSSANQHLNSDLRDVQSKLTDENENLIRELESMNARMAELASHIEGIESSTSWRVARRLQDALRFFRSLRSP